MAQNIAPVGVHRPNLNPSPKFRFQESQQVVSEHREMVAARPFQRACDFALLEYQAQVAQEVSANPNLASVAGFKLTGAQEFLMTMRLLSEAPMPISRQPVQNLNHQA